MHPLLKLMQNNWSDKKSSPKKKHTHLRSISNLVRQRRAFYAINISTTASEVVNVDIRKK